MKSWVTKQSLGLFLVCAAALQAHARATPDIKHWFTPQGNGKFSAAAHNVCKHAGSGDEIWSPNHLRKIVTRPGSDGATTIFAVDEAGRESAIDTAAWSCPEIGWSPRSTHFFVTYSRGGAVGTYHVSVYRIAAGRIEKIDLTGAVRRDFEKHYPKCDSPEEANIAGLAWSADSTKLLVAAQVLPHANCDDMGTFKVYAVAVPSGKIIARIPQSAAKASLYGLLGQELRAADDGCSSNPRSCWISTLHPRKKASHK